MQPSPLLHDATLSFLKQTKNLLAFSGGIDSTALFFLLLEHDIPFDIAHVNYQTRAQSNDEETYAKELSHTHHKALFTFTCKLETSNFEHHAREQRYAFFERVCQEHHYTTLLSAHHLGDQLEWFLMQLSRGSGLVEMLGMQEVEPKETYTLVRPLLHVSKKKLQTYLKERHIYAFYDESNDSPKHLRNRFRHDFSNPLLEAFEEGIAKSFAYMAEDAKRLLPSQATRINKLFILPRNRDDLINIRHIDKVLKRLGVVASHEQRNEMMKTTSSVVGGKIAVCFEEEKIFIAPYLKVTMDKPFKEACRKASIPAKIRPYLYTSGIDISVLR